MREPHDGISLLMNLLKMIQLAQNNLSGKLLLSLFKIACGFHIRKLTTPEGRSNRRTVAYMETVLNNRELLLLRCG